MRIKSFILAGLAFFAMTAAHAADLPRITQPPVIEPFPQETYGGWYLRGDIGYALMHNSGADFNNTGGAHVAFYDVNFRGSIVGDVGAGYRWNEWFRTDLTVGYRFPKRYRGRTPCPCPGGYTDNKTNLESWLFLANAYVDLGHFNGFSPYVGGGVGFAYHRMSRLTGVNSNGTAAVPFEKGDSTSFAAAVHAGVSYDFSSALSLDASYRYVWLGDAKSGSDGFGGNVTLKNIRAHDFRVGLRYTFF